MLFNASDRYRQQMEKTEARWLDAQRRQAELTALSQARMLLIGGIAVIAMLWLASAGVGGDTQPGALIALFVFCALAAFEALAPVTGAFQHLGQVIASAKRITQITEQEPEVTFTHGEGQTLENVSLRLHQVTFSYPQQPSPALEKVSLQIEAGEHIAILGRTGCGKSTLLQAMMGNVELVSGELRLDDLSLPQIDLADIRRNATLLTQEARLFHGTLRENLILGRPAATDDEIFSVLTLCGALEFVRKLPLGLEHVIMEGGLGLSGGQRQSLLLARTLLRDPNIILLDEPTSFFDERTEKAFVEQLAQWAGERTMIIATHKAAVLNIVDRILVIQDGQLALDKPKATVFEQEKARGQVVNI